MHFFVAYFVRNPPNPKEMNILITVIYLYYFYSPTAEHLQCVDRVINPCDSTCLAFKYFTAPEEVYAELIHQQAVPGSQ